MLEFKRLVIRIGSRIGDLEGKVSLGGWCRGEW